MKCGDQVCFHGAFRNKADAVKKEQATPGAFIRGVPFAVGDYRYLVMTRNKSNPRRKNGSLVDAIRPGDRVTILTRHGQERTGRAVMRSSTGGWVLNLGGPHGTPGLADEDNIVKVKKKNPRRVSQEGAKQRVAMKRSLRAAGVDVPNEIATGKLKELYRKVIGGSTSKNALLKQLQIVLGSRKNPRRRSTRKTVRRRKPSAKYMVVRGSATNPTPIMGGLSSAAATSAARSLASHFGKGHKIRKVRVR